ncbi:MAG: Glu-tRNA(Gln) amidotransferase subunit GatD [Candidatus Woesearchaeota archaeon]|nr:Glu-tRNA(Gln) amidotransferase subunit GatD [Candidatus Woesearchaeota archaeon]
MADTGDRVKLICKDEEYEGILMPSNKDSYFIKLNNGYNIGIEKSEVREIKVIEKARSVKEAKVEAKKNPKLPTISILHTGGTIASKVDYRTGAVYTAFSPSDLLNMFPELSEIANFESELIANMWSDDFRFAHFSLIAKAVEKHIKKGVDGIIIGMGTDNLAVGAAALAFMLDNLPIPVVIVGAQRSSDRGSSDAGMNLICAAHFIAKSDFSGVAICMHGKSSDEKCLIMPPCKTRKLHASRRDAFKVVNDEPIASIDYKTKKIEFIKKDYTKKDKKRDVVIKPNMEDKVGLIKVHVNMFPEQFSFFKGYRGLVIEGTGFGHTPGHAQNPEAEINKKIFPAIKDVIGSGCIVVMTTQCIFGRVSLNVYDKGRDLQALGVVSGEDMLAETALVKLAWLLGNYNDKEKVKELMRKNLRGEITERTEYKEEFLE